MDESKRQMKMTLAVLAGVFLDFLIGDPQGWYHPVRLMGWMIAKTEVLVRKVFPKGAFGERCAGVFLWMVLIVASTAVPALLLWFLGWLYAPCKYLAAAVMSYQVMATKSLKDESMKVYQSLKKGDLDEARYHVSMIVGRDTDVLDDCGVAKAAVETVAENTSDGSIAPLFYLMLGGPVCAFAYKAVNTMDSMLGYKNGRYRYLGWFPARMDDIWNFIPARLAAGIMLASAWLCGYDAKGGWRIFKRDRKKSPSPNAAQTESVCAGVLGLELLGDAVYFGEVHHKERIGDAMRQIEAEDICRANRLLYATVILASACFAVVRCLACIL